MHVVKKWYPIGLDKQRFEKTIQLLGKKKIETYIPLNRVSREDEASGQSFTYRLLFDDLVFVRIGDDEIKTVKQIDGVHHFCYWRNEYAVVNGDDLETLKIFLELYTDVWIEKVPLYGYKKENDQEIPDVRNGDIFLEKIFLPTLGYYLVTKVSQNTRMEVLRKAVV